MARYNTQPASASRHPGQVVLDADKEGRHTCRSPAEAQRDRDEKERVAAKEAAERDAVARRIAQLEAQVARERAKVAELAGKSLEREDLVNHSPLVTGSSKTLVNGGVDSSTRADKVSSIVSEYIHLNPSLTNTR